MAYEQAATVATEPTNAFFEHAGLKLHYLDWGGDPKKRTFVLLHGGGAHAHWWDYVAPELSAHGHVVALDFRAAVRGRSTGITAPRHMFMTPARSSITSIPRSC